MTLKVKRAVHSLESKAKMVSAAKRLIADGETVFSASKKQGISKQVYYHYWDDCKKSGINFGPKGEYTPVTTESKVTTVKKPLKKAKSILTKKPSKERASRLPVIKTESITLMIGKIAVTGSPEALKQILF